ncbi:MAG: bacillithiol biosynthesis cysteine-adding enzyme BshC [Bacteroidota bacterium]
MTYARLDGFTDLFCAYASGDEALLAHYARAPYNLVARATAAEEAADHPRDRDALADILLDQNRRWYTEDGTAWDAARANIEALRDGETAAVVTGQQLGLFGGPLYTLYKTLTALQLARQMTEETDRRVVPVFWLEGEDHDFAEIRALTVTHRNELQRIVYDDGAAPHADRGAVGRLVLTDAVTTALDALEEALLPTEFREALMAKVRAAYAPGTSVLDAFGRLMVALLGDLEAPSGLVFIADDDVRLHRLVTPLFRAELEDPAATLDAMAQASDALRADFHAQVTPMPVNLFYLTDDARTAIDPLEGPDGEPDPSGASGFRLRGTEQTFTQAELIAELEAHPERFSPNVVLRPLTQDSLLPTAAYVAGPGEVAYFAQYRGIYERFGVPMPVVYPRASATLVEGKIQKVLDRYGLALPDLQGDLHVLHRRLALAAADADLGAAFGDAQRCLHQSINSLKPLIESIDKGLVSSAEATRAALQKEFAKLKDRIERAQKRNEDVILDHLEKAAVGLVPGGKLQERSLSALYFLNKYGPALLHRWHAELPLDTSQHAVWEV